MGNRLDRTADVREWPHMNGTSSSILQPPPAALWKRAGMWVAGLGYLYLVFLDLRDARDAGGPPRLPLFLPVGIGLISGSRTVCQIGRVCAWFLILTCVVLAVMMASAKYHPGVPTPEQAGIGLAIGLVYAVTGETLLRIRIRWSKKILE